MSKHTFSDQIRSTAKMVLFSMLLVFGLALPGILLYEISLLLVRLIERKRLRREAAETAE